MLISFKKKVLDSKGFKRVERKSGYTYYLSGLLFMIGKKAGNESLFTLADEYENTDMIPFSKLYGAFSCIIVKPNGDIIMFSDNSNMHCFFISETAVSSSFLSLVRYLAKETPNKLTFDEEAISEFYTLGNIYFGKTLFNGIRVSCSKEYFEIKSNGISVLDKEIGDIEDPTAILDPASFLRDVAYAISDEKVCLALTGGFDSRMLFACMNKYIEITPTISGNNESAKDITIANKVSKIANKQLDIVNVQKPHLDEDSLWEQFEVSDGMQNFIKDSRFRWNAFIKAQINKGYQYHLTGDGGVLHKDWEWMQDIPFYHRKNTNIKRYYHQRIAGQYKANNLGLRLKSFAESQESRFVESLVKYKKSINTQSYDALYNYVYGNRILSYNIGSDKFSSYAPLQELEMVRYSYKLPRRERFFCNSIRKITTNANSLMAQLPTSHGTTSSSKKTLIVRDGFIQLFNYFIKVLRLVGRKLFRKTFFIENIVTWTTSDDIRNLQVSQKALEYCIESSYITPSTKIKDLTNQQLGSLIHIYFLAKEAQLYLIK